MSPGFVSVLLYNRVYTWTNELFCTLEVRGTPEGFYCQHTVSVYFWTLELVQFIFRSIIIGFAVYITVCVCCSMDTVLWNVIWSFFSFVAVGLCLISVAVNIMLCHTTWLHFFPPHKSQNPLCTVIRPSPFLSYFNTGALREEVYRGIILLSYILTIKGTCIFDWNIVTGLYLVQKWVFCSFSLYSPLSVTVLSN